MSILLHHCSFSALPLSANRRRRFSQLTPLSYASRRHQPLKSVFDSSAHSNRRFSSVRRDVSSGRRELLHSTALLTLPTTSRDDSTISSQQPSASSKEAKVSSTSSSNDDSRGEQRGGEQRAAACRPPNPILRISAPGRIIAVGDIHGDIVKAIALFKMVGVVEECEKGLVWVGGDATVVQLGDVLDRGSREIASLQLLRNLDSQARRQGGSVHMLNGNHESLNVAGEYRYATLGGMLESVAVAGYRGNQVYAKPLQNYARSRLFGPGGPLARELARNATVLIVNDTLFAHGGVTMSHVQYGLDRINAEVASWMRGDRMSDGSFAPPPFLAMG